MTEAKTKTKIAPPELPTVLYGEGPPDVDAEGSVYVDILTDVMYTHAAGVWGELPRIQYLMQVSQGNPKETP